MNNEDKILALLEKMDNRLGNVESRLESVDTRIGNLENDQIILARQVYTLTEDVQSIRQSQVRMENELTKKVLALFDAREVQNDVNEHPLYSLNRIEAKVDVLQMETTNIRRVK